MEVCIKLSCLGCADDKMNIFRLLSLGHLSNVVNYINPDTVQTWMLIKLNSKAVVHIYWGEGERNVAL